MSAAATASAQLTLPLGRQDFAVFDTFWAPPGDPLPEYLRALGSAAGAAGCWLRGAPATGKSHLLQAVCASLGDDSVYVPLKLLADMGPGVLDGLASRRCLCLDDIDAVAGQADWELALFALCNEVIDRRGLAVVSAGAAPRDCGLDLPDLVSRLGRLPVFRLRPLDEDGCLQALRLRAYHRGLQLPEETARYVLQRSRRDMESLYALLDRLDSESLREQRRLTVPFEREVLRRAAD